MIIRISEALIQTDQVKAFMLRLEELVAEFPAAHPGLVRHEVLVDLDDERRVQYVSWWRDEASIVGFAGQCWRSEPVTFPDEDSFLEAPLRLRHFVSGD